MAKYLHRRENIMSGRLSVFLEQKALWIAVILSQIIIGLTAIIVPIPYVVILMILIPFLAIFYLKPIFALLLLIIFLPDYPIIFFSLGRADITLFELTFLIAFLCWFFLCVHDRAIRFYGSTIDIPIFLIFSWCLFSLFWTVSIDRGIFQIIKITPSILVYYLFIHMIKNKREFNFILSAWIITALSFSIVGFYETIVYGINAASQLVITETYTHLTRAVRAEAFFTSPDTLGLVLSLSIILAITKFMITPSKKWRLFITIFLPLMFFVFVSTFSRKSYLALLAALTYLGWRNKKTFLYFGGISLVGLLLITLLASGGFLEALWNRLQTYFMAPEVTITKRWIAWGIALKLFSESPIIGNGIGSFFVSAQVLESPLNITHNFYLYILAELGLVGLILVLFWYFQILRSFNTFFKQNKDKSVQVIARGMISGLIVLLVQSFFRTFQFTDPLFWGFLGLASAFLKVYKPGKDNDSPILSGAQSMHTEDNHG